MYIFLGKNLSPANKNYYFIYFILKLSLIISKKLFNGIAVNRIAFKTKYHQIMEA